MATPTDEENAVLTSPPRPGAHRLKNYKTRGLDVDKIRTRKEEEGVQLRKEKRQEQLIKRRNLSGEKAKPKVGDKDSKDDHCLPLVDELGQNSIPGSDHGNDRKDDASNKEDGLEIKNANTIINKFKEEQLNADTPLDRLVYFVQEGISDKRAKAVRLIRLILSRPDPPIDDVVDTGVIPDLVQCISAEEPESLQMEAAWALTNIASGTSDHTRSVVEAGAVPRLIQLLESPNEQIKEQVIWALGNITGDCPENRDLVIDFGIIRTLSEIIGNSEELVLVRRQASWTLSNLCRHKVSPLSEDIVDEMFPIYYNGLSKEDDLLALKELCWGISYLTDDCSENRMTRFLNIEILPFIITLLDEDDRDILHPVVRIIGNITTSTDDHTQKIIDHACLPKLKYLLSHPADNIKREVCWTLSNVTAGTIQQKQAVIDENIVPKFLDILSGDDIFRLKKEAVWAFANIAEGATAQQISYLVGLGGLQTLCQSLKMNDAQFITVALDGILAILGSGEEKKNENNLASNPYSLIMFEFSDIIDDLLSHDNIEIYRKACKVRDHLDSEESLNEIGERRSEANRDCKYQNRN